MNRQETLGDAEKAAEYIRNLLHGKITLKQRAFHSKRYRLCQRLKLVLALAIFTYMALSLFEKPFWCYDTGHSDCKVKLENGNIVTVPWSNIPKMPQKTLHITEVVCLCIFLFFATLKHPLKKRRRLSNIRVYVLFALLIIALLDNAAALFINEIWYFALFLRPAIFILLVRAIRESFIRIYYVMKEALPVLILIIAHILFFA